MKELVEKRPKKPGEVLTASPVFWAKFNPDGTEEIVTEVPEGEVVILGTGCGLLFRRRGRRRDHLLTCVEG